MLLQKNSWYKREWKWSCQKAIVLTHHPLQNTFLGAVWARGPYSGPIFSCGFGDAKITFGVLLVLVWELKKCNEIWLVTWLPPFLKSIFFFILLVQSLFRGASHLWVIPSVLFYRLEDTIRYKYALHVAQNMSHIVSWDHGGLIFRPREHDMWI